MIEPTPQQLSDLDPEQLDFLLRRLRRAGRKADGDAVSQLIPRRQEPGPQPLSFAQQRLWFIHQLEQRSTAYHIPIAVDLAGPLRLPCLRAALAAVVRRHEALRTTFELAGGHPVQVVRAAVAPALPLVDLAALPADAEPLAAELARLSAET